MSRAALRVIAIASVVAVILCGALVALARETAATQSLPDSPPPLTTTAPTIIEKVKETLSQHEMLLVVVSDGDERQGQTTEQVEALLSTLGGTKRIGAAWSWMLYTRYSMVDVRDALSKNMGAADKIFVTTVNGWASNMSDGEHEWLRARK